MNESVARDEALALMRELELEPEHVRHVTALALQLFDGLTALHGLAAGDRLLLECASLLHDVGWSAAPDGRRHHKESARLIREHAWSGLEEQEVGIVSLVARYHRRGMPSGRHKRFRRLGSADRERVRRLAALLRVADGLDRRHQGYVQAVNSVLLEERLLFQLRATRAPDVEIGAAEAKGDLMRTVFDRQLGFVVAP